MRFSANGCECGKPMIDVVTFTVNYGYSNKSYVGLLDVVVRDVTLHTRKNNKDCKYIPTMNITFEPPSYALCGWGRIYFEPTKYKLHFLQKWLWDWVDGDVEVMSKKIKLSRCELAYDFGISNKGYVFHAGLAKRLWWHLWPKKGRNLYATYMTRNLNATWLDPKLHDYRCFANLDEAIRYYGRCSDGAVNGDFTGYIQVCKNSKKQCSSHSLAVNPRASKHTTIYPKGIDEVWRVRVEMELAKSAIKILRFKNTNFPGLLDNLPSFDEFYEFRDVDFTTFKNHIFSLPESEALRSNVWQKRINEVEFMPTADKIRMMRVMANEVGKKRWKDGILKKYTRIISFQKILNTRLASTASPSKRMKKGTKPDDMPFREWLGMLIHIGNNQHKIMPLHDMKMEQAACQVKAVKIANSRCIVKRM